MNREEVRKLLGGYATGTLTPVEQETLFAAALEDQDLFEALAREQPVAELLRDPAAKLELLRALDAGAEPRAWWRWRPLIAAVAMVGVAMAVVAVWRQSREKAPVIVAEMRKTEVPAAAPAPAPLSAPATTPAPVQRAPTPSELKASRNPPVKIQAVPPVQAFAPPPIKEPVPTENSAVSARSGQLTIPPVAVAGPPLPGVGGVVGGARRAEGVRDQSGTLAAPVMAKAAAPAPILRWAILRRGMEVPADTLLEAGDTVQLRITAAEDGTVEVLDGERLLESATVSKGVAFSTAALPFSRELRVRLVRGAQIAEIRVELRYR